MQSEVGKGLKTLRELVKISQEEFSSKIGLSPAQIYRIENSVDEFVINIRFVHLVLWFSITRNEAKENGSRALVKKINKLQAQIESKLKTALLKGEV